MSTSIALLFTLAFLIALSATANQVLGFEMKVSNPPQQGGKSPPQACAPGFYYNPVCTACLFGYYCPGDGKSYKCPAGTIAEIPGLHSCFSCSSGRSNFERTVCVSGAPLLVEIFDGQPIEISSKSPIYFKTLSYVDTTTAKGQYPVHGIQYTFLNNVKSNMNVPLEIYASTMTANPNEKHFENHAIGLNATLYHANYERIYFEILYMNVTTVNPQQSAVFIGQEFLYYNWEENVINGFHQFEGQLLLAQNEVLYRVKGIPENQLVNFTVSYKDDYGVDSKVQFALYYSELPTVEYPNVNNANIVVKSPFAVLSRASLTAVKKTGVDQDFIVAFVAGVAYDAKITVNVQWLPIK